MFREKRELLSRLLYWSGITAFAGILPSRNALLVLNYHRIGNPHDDPFDPGVFSATPEEFDDQLGFLQRHLSIVTLDEAEAFVSGKADGRSPRCRVLITFDDGYLDNYELAFPILSSHGMQGVFFLATSLVGSGHIPWWDHVAFVLKTARNRKFRLRYPIDYEADLDRDGIQTSLRDVLAVYKRPDNNCPGRFLAELQDATRGDAPPEGVRRFLSWAEAQQMIAGGMAVGSHTHSHTVLSQLDPKRQYAELAESLANIESTLGQKVSAIAYPVGAVNSFSAQTKGLAKQAGYGMAFSFYGGTNLSGRIDPYDVKRVGIGDQSQTRFRVQTATCKLTGRYLP